MRNMTKMILVLLPMAASAVTVKSPLAGTAMVTTYTSSGVFHGAVDVTSGRCNYWGLLTPLVGSYAWNVTIRNTTATCSNTTGNDNDVKHVFANGYTIRVANFIKTADSYDRTCDRCAFGNENVGAAISTYLHVEVTKNGTLDTSWYAGYTTPGEAIDLNEVLGVF